MLSPHPIFIDMKHLLVGGLEYQFYFPINIGNNHPNWLIFFRGVQTTNQEISRAMAWRVFFKCGKAGHSEIAEMSWESLKGKPMERGRGRQSKSEVKAQSETSVLKDRKGIPIDWLIFQTDWTNGCHYHNTLIHFSSIFFFRGSYTVEPPSQLSWFICRLTKNCCRYVYTL